MNLAGSHQVQIIATKRGPIQHISGCRHITVQVNRGVDVPLGQCGTALEILGTATAADGRTMPGRPRDAAPCLMEALWSRACAEMGI